MLLSTIKQFISKLIINYNAVNQLSVLSIEFHNNVQMPKDSMAIQRCNDFSLYLPNVTNLLPKLNQIQHDCNAWPVFIASNNKIRQVEPTFLKVNTNPDNSNSEIVKDKVTRHIDCHLNQFFAPEENYEEYNLNFFNIF